MTEHFDTSLKKGRGRAQRSLDLIEAMYEIAEDGQPITGTWCRLQTVLAKPDSVDGS